MISKIVIRQSRNYSCFSASIRTERLFIHFFSSSLFGRPALYRFSIEALEFSKHSFICLGLNSQWCSNFEIPVSSFIFQQSCEDLTWLITIFKFVLHIILTYLIQSIKKFQFNLCRLLLFFYLSRIW